MPEEDIDANSTCKILLNEFHYASDLETMFTIALCIKKVRGFDRLRQNENINKL